jgi:hypothetical protein
MRLPTGPEIIDRGSGEALLAFTSQLAGVWTTCGYG